MGFFDGLADVEAGGRGNPFKPGNYPELTVQTVRRISGFHGERIIIEAKVTKEPTARDFHSGDPVVPTPVGATASISIKIDGARTESGQKDFKSFLGAAHGMSADRVNAIGKDIVPMATKALDPSNPLEGRVFAAEMTEITTKGGHPFLRVFYRPIEGEGSVGPVAAPPAPPAPPPVAPAGLVPPPTGWFHFPEGDPRRGKLVYGPGGATQPL